VEEEFMKFIFYLSPHEAYLKFMRWKIRNRFYGFFIPNLRKVVDLEK